MSETQRPENRGNVLETTTFHLPRPRFATGIEPAWQMSVEVVGGPMDGTRRRVEGDTLTIGRKAENDLCLAMDPSVSGRHARLVREGQTFWLEDRGSRNGTFLGDQRLGERVPIGPGSTFMTGRTQIDFMPR